MEKDNIPPGFVQVSPGAARVQQNESMAGVDRRSLESLGESRSESETHFHSHSSLPGRQTNRIIPFQNLDSAAALASRKLYIVREIYDSEHAVENFEQQLERALSAETETIVIEPGRLGDETARWITVGNCLHKSSVLGGLGSIVCSMVWPNKPWIYVPPTVISLLCMGLYTVSWQNDPCCKYQVETNAGVLLSRLSLQNLNTASPIVIVRKDDSKRKFLHNVISLLSVAFTSWRLFAPPVSFFGASRMVNSFSESNPNQLANVVNLSHHSIDPSTAGGLFTMSIKSADDYANLMYTK